MVYIFHTYSASELIWYNIYHFVPDNLISSQAKANMYVHIVIPRFPRDVIVRVLHQHIRRVTCPCHVPEIIVLQPRQKDTISYDNNGDVEMLQYLVRNQITFRLFTRCLHVLESLLALDSLLLYLERFVSLPSRIM